jgi:uncharacterized protein (DUF2235 family)
VKNIVLCFDSTRDGLGPRDATNAEALFRLLDDSDPDRQITWYDEGAAALMTAQMFNPAARQWRKAVGEEARASVVDAYAFLADRWQPNDRIFLLGVGRGAYCARALATMLGAVGMLSDRSDNLLEYSLAAYTLPRTRRTPQDWRQVHRLAEHLFGQRDISVPVHFLGLWDTVKMPGLPRLSAADPLTNVVAGRHAVAIDGGYGPLGECLVARQEGIEEVWFRGAHCDIAGGPNAYWPLADITLDWMLDAAVKAGAVVRTTGVSKKPAPTERDALAEGARTVPFRKLPYDALVHASVGVYLRAHPEYWRRLPGHVFWADIDWAARSERLLRAPTTPTVPTVPATAAGAEPEVVTKVASYAASRP